MSAELENLTIGSFAKIAEVSVETIRFYQRQGLLPQPQRPYAGFRRYGASDIARVRFIKSAQSLGFSLSEVEELLRLDDGTHCAEASQLAECKLRDVCAKIANLQRMESALSELICACHAMECQVSCPLISSLHR